MNASALVQQLWNDRSALRDDGMRYRDYVQQRTRLLSQDMVDERKCLATVASCTSAPLVAGAETEAGPKRSQSLCASRLATTFRRSGNPK